MSFAPRFLAALGLCLGAAAQADVWHGQLSATGSSGRYDAAVSRDRLSSQGLQAEFAYRDRAELALGYRQTEVDYLVAGPGLQQTEASLRGAWHLYPDAVPGRLSLSAVLVRIDNADDPTGQVEVIAPRLSLSDYDQRVRLKLGGARSDYAAGFVVDQQDASLGTRIGADWLELGAQRVTVDTAEPLQAYRLLWQHAFPLASAWRPDWAALRLDAGERRYAVEHDSAIVYNLDDTQRGGAGLALHWRPGARLGLLLGLGRERFHNDSSGNDYRSVYLHSELSYQW